MHTETRAPGTKLPPALNHVWIAVVVLTLCSVAFSWICYMRGGGPELYLALSKPGEHFTDFSIYEDKFHFLHTADFFDEGFPFTYPAPTALVFAFFYSLGRNDLIFFLMVSGLALIVPAVLFARALVRRGIATPLASGFALTLLVCSWPAALVFDRGNVEVTVWIALALAAWAYFKDRFYTAAVFFALAASLKLFPFVYIGLFLSRRKWKPALLFVCVFVTVSVAALAFVGPTVHDALGGISDGLLFFKNDYMARWKVRESGVDHSLFALVKLLGTQLFNQDVQSSFLGELDIYTYVTAAVGLALYFFRIRVLPAANQLLALCVASILFTGFSGDGTLLHLYCPFALLALMAIEAQRRQLVVRGLQAALLLFAFLFSYESFFAKPDQRFEGEVKCFALCVLLFISLRFRFEMPTGSPRESPDGLRAPA